VKNAQHITKGMYLFNDKVCSSHGQNNNTVHITQVHRVSKKNDNDVAHYNFNAH